MNGGTAMFQQEALPIPTLVTNLNLILSAHYSVERIIKNIYYEEKNNIIAPALAKYNGFIILPTKPYLKFRGASLSGSGYRSRQHFDKKH